MEETMEETMVIVVYPAGWVFVGELSSTPDASGYSTLRRAACVRSWGTTAGLGQLAVVGVSPDTILDPAGIVRWKAGTEIIIIPVCAAAAATFRY